MVRRQLRQPGRLARHHRVAVRAGAVAADAEFVQFHPTAIDCAEDPLPLATEALRGEGAWLVDRLLEGYPKP